MFETLLIIASLFIPQPMVTVVVAQPVGVDYQSRGYILEDHIKSVQEWYAQQLDGHTWDYRIIWTTTAPADPWGDAVMLHETGIAGNGILLYISGYADGFAGSNERISVVGGALLKYLYGAWVPGRIHQRGVVAHELAHAMGLGEHTEGIMAEGVQDWPWTYFNAADKAALLASGFVK